VNDDLPLAVMQAVPAASQPMADRQQGNFRRRKMLWIMSCMCAIILGKFLLKQSHRIKYLYNNYFIVAINGDCHDILYDW